MDYPNLIRTYIDDALTPAANQQFEERLEKEEAELNEALAGFFALPENEEWKIRFNDKRANAESQRQDLLNLLNTYMEKEGEEIPLSDQIIFDFHSGYLVEKDKEIIQQIVSKFPGIEAHMVAQKEILDQIKIAKERQAIKDSIAAVKAELNAEHFFDETEEEAISISPPPAKTIPLHYGRKWLIAASIALLVSAGLYFLLPSTPDYNQLFADHHKKEELLINQLLDKVGRSGLGTPENPQKELKQPLELYQTSDYSNSEKALQDYIKNNPTDEDAVFLLGITQMELGHYAAAQATLKPLTEKENNWKAEATFQLAMVYLKDKNTAPLSKALLLQISQQEDAYYQQDALRILKDFN